MKEFSVLMALADFLPVALFAAASVILQRELHAKMSKGAFALFAAGTIDVIFAGAFKALYKLLYALRLCDFEKLNAVFFPMQSVGFLLAGIGILALLTHRQSGSALAAAAPPAFSGTFLFVGAMVLGLGMMDAGLFLPDDLVTDRLSLDELPAAMARYGISDLNELIGGAHHG